MKIKSILSLLLLSVMICASHLFIGQSIWDPIVISPQINPDNTVIFRYLAPKAIEDGLYRFIDKYFKVLDEKGIHYEKFISDGRHTWMNCKLYLSIIAQELFK